MPTDDIYKIMYESKRELHNNSVQKTTMHTHTRTLKTRRTSNQKERMRQAKADSAKYCQSFYCHFCCKVHLKKIKQGTLLAIQNKWMWKRKGERTGIAYMHDIYIIEAFPIQNSTGIHSIILFRIVSLSLTLMCLLSFVSVFLSICFVLLLVF